MTGGANGVARRITDGIVPGEFYPNHEASTSTTPTRKM